MNILASSAAAGGGSMIGVILMYVAVFGVFFYFVMYRPQKKEQKKMNDMLSTLEIGDSILTTSGFYGNVIDMIYISKIDFPVFNLSDMFISLGTIFTIIIVLFRLKEKDFEFLNFKQNKYREIK